MRINKKILAGLTAVSMLTCGIWMESVFAADTFSAEETKEAVSDTVTDLSAESITGTETEDVPVMDAAEPENKSEISETPEMSDEPAAQDNPETQDTSETPEETELPENEEADIPQEMLPDDQPEAAFEENAASEDMETETDPAEEKSGFCGAEENTVSWSLDESGVLEIAGQGAMNEWQNEEEVPWNGYRDQITEVRIK